jgi:peptidoglycan/LPS O-acetylase OafA/YrhL
VSLVIGYHLAPRTLPGGFIGVDVFFVISGYLITLLVLSELATGRFSLGDFYRRRVRRIVPALLLVLATSLLVGWYTLLPGEFRWFGSSLLWCAPFLANVFFAHATGYFDPGADSNVLLHLWSLGVEEQFYLVWPLLLLLAVRCGVRTQVLVAVFATSLAISLWGARAAPLVHYYLPGPRAWELTAGGLLAAHTLDGSTRHPWPPLTALLGIVLIFGGARWLNAGDAFPGLWGLVPCGGALLLIGAGARARVNHALLAHRAMVWLGRRSYSLYLWHWPVLSYARIVCGREPPALELAAAVVLSLLLADLSYRLVEEPLRRGALKRMAVPALLAGLAGFTLLGTAVARGHLAGRLSGAAFAPWEAASSDWQIGDEGSIDRRTGFQEMRLPGATAATTLFIGDSHLQQYWPRIREVLARHPRAAHSVLFLAYAGCPMLPGVNALRQPRDCAGFFSQASARAFDPHIDTVVIGAFWELYLLGEYAQPRQHGVFRDGDVLRRPLQLESSAARAALAQFADLLGRLTSSGRRVYIVLSNPTSPQFDPPSLIPPRLRLGAAPRAVFRAASMRYVDAAPYEAFVAPLMEQLRDVAARSGARVLDPLISLCDGVQCPAVSPGGLPLYIDSNHLGAAYARERAAFLDETLLAPSVVPVVAAREQQEHEAAGEQVSPACAPGHEAALPCRRVAR